MREALGLKPGDRVVEVDSERAVLIFPVPRKPSEAARAMLGMLKERGLSAEEMKAWLDQGELD